jgi:LuxR family maltose regulon positive regulatory protein
MKTAISLEDQLLITKFYTPIASGPLISRPRLTSLLEKALDFPFTLVSAPAGFGKTTLLAAWKQSLPAGKPLVAWVSLDEDDNEPRLFWTYVLAALQRQRPAVFAPLVRLLQSPPAPPLQSILAGLINALIEQSDEFLLILDDYQLITEPQVHKTLAYLIDHLPPHLHLILATRADPPLPLPLLLARRHALEVRADQLRCTLQETKAFFQEAMSLQFPDEVIQEVWDRTEGWLVGLQLLGLSLPERADPLTFLREVSGDQRYILDYLTQEVLQRQPQEVQTFLLCTSVLDQLSASLCDAVMDQTGSLQMLRRLEQTNLFIVSLDTKREWYRYHALFAEALRNRLEWTHADLIPSLHYRASLWYAQHSQTTQAVLHAFQAKKWDWAAELVERHPLLSMTWGASKHGFAMFQQWLEQLPTEAVHSRPRLCFECTSLMWSSAPLPRLQSWLDTAEAALMALLANQAPKDTSRSLLLSQATQEQKDLLGVIISFRALLQSFQPDGELALPLCQQALELLSLDNSMVRATVFRISSTVYYSSSLNDTEAARNDIMQAISLAWAAGQSALAIDLVGTILPGLIATGQLHEAYLMSHQIAQQEQQSAGRVFPYLGYLAIFRADILREWNDLDNACSLAEEAVSLCQQAESLVSIIFLFWGYAALLRVYLSCGKLEAAYSALQQFEHVGMQMNQFTYSYMRASFATDNSIRLWLASGKLDQATRWVEELDAREWRGTPLAREREAVACARVHLATAQPALALQRLKPALQRATTGQRWGHVIETLLLQALAYQMLQEEPQALDALAEVVRLAEPEGYIRRFVDEGTPMQALLSQLRQHDHMHGPTPYLDKLLAVFQQERKPERATGEPAKASRTPELLSQRELEVLQLLAQGRSNQQIAQELVITIDTVKRHISHIFAKLGVQNRVQAARQARELGLLSEEL